MTKKICNICNIRPVDKAAGIDDACVPCYEEGAWENAHNDGDHDGLQAILKGLDETGAVALRKLAGNPHIKIKNAAKFKSAELRVLIREAIEQEQHGCWICHPELNEAQKAKKRRKASTAERPSRKGQKIHVPLRATGEEKAAEVAKAAPNAPVKVEREKYGTVRLDITTPTFVLILAWDERGRYNYAGSVASVGGKQKKVRNVSEALRMLAEVGLI